MASIEEGKEVGGSEPPFGQGFLSNYSLSNLENDFNVFAEVALTEPGRLKELSAEYPRIRQKTTMLMEFYGGLLKPDTSTCAVLNCDE